MSPFNVPSSLNSSFTFNAFMHSLKQLYLVLLLASLGKVDINVLRKKTMALGNESPFFLSTQPLGDYCHLKLKDLLLMMSLVQNKIPKCLPTSLWTKPWEPVPPAGIILKPRKYGKHQIGALLAIVLFWVWIARRQSLGLTFLRKCMLGRSKYIRSS